MGGAPSMPSETTTVSKTELSPEQKRFLVPGYERAQSLFLNSSPNYFPKSTVVPYAPETETALQLQTQRALLGSPTQNAANQELAKTLRGDYLYGGDAFNRAQQAAANQIIPQVQGAFAQGGRLNSGLAQTAVAQALGDSFAKQYGDERMNQQRAAFAAPQQAMADYQDIAQLGSVGAARESLQAQQLADEMARFEFNQNVGRNQLVNYLNLVGQMPGSTTTTTGPNPYYYQQSQKNPFMSMMGGAMFGSSLFGGPLGALGGGVLGALNLF